MSRLSLCYVVIISLVYNRVYATANCALTKGKAYSGDTGSLDLACATVISQASLAARSTFYSQPWMAYSCIAIVLAAAIFAYSVFVITSVEKRFSAFFLSTILFSSILVAHLRLNKLFFYQYYEYFNEYDASCRLTGQQWLQHFASGHFRPSGDSGVVETKLRVEAWSNCDLTFDSANTKLTTLVPETTCFVNFKNLFNRYKETQKTDEDYWQFREKILKERFPDKQAKKIARYERNFDSLILHEILNFDETFLACFWFYEKKSN